MKIEFNGRVVAGFFLGAVCGAVAALLAASGPVGPIQHERDDARSKVEKLIADLGQAQNATADAAQARAYSTDVETKLASCLDDADSQRRIVQGLNDVESTWFTMVYMPDKTSAQSPLELLNVYRPGLGTMLAKLQPPAPQQLQLRFLLRGYVVPLVTPNDGSRLVYTRNPGAVAGN